MPKVFINDTSLTAIGDAIRKKGNTSALLYPSEMPKAIEDIVTGDGSGTYAWRKYKKISAEDKNTKLLLHGEDIVDSSEYKVSLTNNGVQTSATQSKFGGKSLYFDGKSILKTPLPVSGDMTVDFWIYFDNYGTAYPTPFFYSSVPDNGSNGVYIHAENAHTTFRVHGVGMQDKTVEAIPTKKWMHIAVVRKGTDTSLFFDGKNKATIQNSSVMANDVFCLGSFTKLPTQSNLSYTGFLDEIRVSNIARWTSDFIPPTEPYDNMTTEYELIDYVVSDDEKAYPDKAEQGGFYYEMINDERLTNLENKVAMLSTTMEVQNTNNQIAVAELAETSAEQNTNNQLATAELAETIAKGVKQ